MWPHQRYQQYLNIRDQMRSLEVSVMAWKLWAHFNQRQHDNLQALTHKWIKEHQ